MINLIQESKDSPIIKELLKFSDVRLWPPVYCESKITGISRAHKQIVRNAKETGLKEVLICEADVKLIGSLQDFINHKPKEYDLYLAGVSSFRSQENIVYSFTGLHCYMISERFYDTFLSADESFNIDFAMSGKGKFYIHSPMIAIQHGKHLEKYWHTVEKRLFYLNTKKSFIFG